MIDILSCRKAQNIIEYAVLFVAVCVVLILFLNRGGGYSSGVESLLEQPKIMIEEAQSKDF